MSKLDPTQARLDLSQMFEKIITPSTIDQSPNIWQQPYIIGDQPSLVGPATGARWEVRPDQLPQYSVIGVSDTKLTSVTQAQANCEPTTNYFIKDDSCDSFAASLRGTSGKT